MMARIEWVRGNCRLLARIGAEFRETAPFEGLTIGTGIHLEPKTVALLLVLRDGGARIVATGNLSSTQPDAVAYLRSRGVEVVGAATTDAAEHDEHLREVLAARPDLLLDNGGDLFVRHLEEPLPALRGGTEETTSGRLRLSPLRDELGVPVLVINDSPIKQFAENRHAVGQSVLESYMRITNQMTNGRTVAVFGYGACGKGVAANFRNAYANVAVVETDPVARLEANLDGFAFPPARTRCAPRTSSSPSPGPSWSSRRPTSSSSRTVRCSATPATSRARSPWPSWPRRTAWSAAMRRGRASRRSSSTTAAARGRRGRRPPPTSSGQRGRPPACAWSRAAEGLDLDPRERRRVAAERRARPFEHGRGEEGGEDDEPATDEQRPAKAARRRESEGHAHEP